MGDLLREEGFSLQSNAKTLEGKQHPDRDAQFHYLNDQARDHQEYWPAVISVVTNITVMANCHRDKSRRLVTAPFRKGRVQASTTGVAADVAFVKRGKAAAPTASRATMPICAYSTPAKAWATLCGAKAR